MENVLKGLQPELVFKYFEEISQIPRGSGNEKAISDYLLNFGKSLGLESIQDDANNIIIKKPATKGYENSPTVIIQGHMDMVCEKNDNIIHDFLKDPLKLKVKDDYIYAEGTTLGADDGIAVAIIMAILADNTLEHPPIEALITTDEERGMTGAMAVSKEHLNGKIVLNIDNEEEGKLLVSCAGGVRTKSSIAFEKERILFQEKIYQLVVKGLKGGHSGSDIDKYRGNANKILGRLLKRLDEKANINLISINGGSKNNAIPREAKAVVTSIEDEGIMSQIVDEFRQEVVNELKVQDANIEILVDIVNKDIDEKINKRCSRNIINLIYLCPNGVNTMSMSIKDLPESSNNLGVITTTENRVMLDCLVRSSVESLKNEIANRIQVLTEQFGGVFEKESDYPGWEYKNESKFRELCKKVYKEMYDKEPEVYAIHAGVECGILKERLGDLDMVSIGPDIIDIHTPDERLSIPSTKRVWEYILEVLKKF